MYVHEKGLVVLRLRLGEGTACYLSFGVRVKPIFWTICVIKV